MRLFVINFNDERPRWAVTDEAVARIEAALPSDWRLLRLESPVSSRGDGGTMVSQEALDAARHAEVYISTGFARELFLVTRNLKWVHTGSAGVGSVLYPEMKASAVILTNSAGIHAAPVAESVIGMVLHFARGFDFAVRSQARGEWDQHAFATFDSPVTEVCGSTLGLIGYGGIGREIARLARALGMNVLATRATPVEQILREADYVVLTVPSTRETRGMIGARQLSLMKRNAVLINIARGNILDQNALIEALRKKSIRGAALDVFEPEPLPASSELWQLPNVLILPHVSATTPRFWEREADLIVDNFGRYIRGEPMRNVVDKEKGY